MQCAKDRTIPADGYERIDVHLIHGHALQPHRISDRYVEDIFLIAECIDHSSGHVNNIVQFHVGVYTVSQLTALRTQDHVPVHHEIEYDPVRYCKEVHSRGEVERHVE